MRLFRTSVSVLVLAAMFRLAVPDVAAAAGPSWLPGFPLRAGAMVILMWAPVPGATEYKLIKKMGDADFAQIYKGAANNFSDPDAPTTKNLVYKVIPVVGGKDGDASLEAVVKGVEPVKPPVITGVLPQETFISLRWSQPQGASFYNLYKAEGKDSGYALVTSLQTDTYTDKNVQAGKKYYYRVSAVDRNNTESEKSEAKTASLLVKAVEEAEQKHVLKKVKLVKEFAGEQLYEFVSPTDIVQRPNGEIWVKEKGSIQILSKDCEFVRRIDLPAAWGAAPRMLVESDDSIYLFFYGSGTIRRINGKGEEQEVITYPPSKEDPAYTNSPYFMQKDGDGNFWIADGNRFQIIVWDPVKKEVVAQLGRIRSAYTAANITEQDLPSVSLIAKNPNDGMLYALLAATAEVKVIDMKTRKVVRTHGGVGQKPGQFITVAGIAFRKNGNILVYDSRGSRVKEFDKNFNYIQTYGDDDKSPFRIKSETASFYFNDDSGKLLFVNQLGNWGYAFDIVP